MPRKRKPTIDEIRSLRQQLHYHIADIVGEFEEITGVKVLHIDIIRGRKIGFNQEEETKIDTTIDL